MFSLTAAELRKRFPDAGRSPAPYCVGATVELALEGFDALSARAAPSDMRFPLYQLPWSRLPRMLRKVSPDLSIWRSYVLSHRIVWANDEEDVERAWGLLGQALWPGRKATRLALRQGVQA